MKNLLLLLCLLAGWRAGLAQAQPKLDSLDAMLARNNPRQFVTAPITNEIIYNAQRFVGGTAIKQGKVVGTNATLDDQSLTLNVGTNIIGRRLALQATAAGTGENKFLSLFKEGDYQKTIVVGATANLFLNPVRGSTFLFFNTPERTRLHNKLRLLRNQDRDSLENLSPAARDARWQTRHDAALASFYKFSVAYPGLPDSLRCFLLDSATYRPRRAAIRSYYRLGKAAEAFLPANWQTMTTAEATRWVRTTLASPALRAARITAMRREAEEALLRKRLALYDNLQVSAP